MHKRSHSICSKIQRCYKYKYNKTSNQELELYIYIFERRKRRRRKKMDKAWNIIQISTKPHKIPVTLILPRKAVRPNRHDIRTMERTVGKARVLGHAWSSQIRFPPMVIAGGASISGASPNTARRR